MKNERAFRVLLGLAIMAATVGGVGAVGGWTKPEPPAEHPAATKPQPTPQAGPQAAPQLAPQPALQSAGKSSAKPEAKAEQVGKPEPARSNAKSEKRAESKPEPKPEPKAEPEPKPESRPEAKADARVDSSPSLAEPRPTPAEALKFLQEGNARWAAGSTQSPNITESRRRTLAEAGQTPFATILSCADSRVPVERVFDRGVGDLFVVRVAGNLAGPHEAGTIEYGAEHLHVPLLVVMGHTRCGAVSAAVAHARVTGNISSLIEAITPAVDRAEALNPSLHDKELVAAAVRENVWQSVFDLIKSSTICRERIRSGELRVVGAVYDIGTGSVEWLGEHPWQRELIAAIDQHETSAHAAAHSDDEPAQGK